MQFVQVGMLGALAALAIPVLLHLLFRNRPRTVDLGTLQFLRIVLSDNARRRRLKRWILLALRLACVALLALLFARPYLLATEPPTVDRLLVVLVDRSASMGFGAPGRPFDRALAEARATIAAAGSKAQVEIALFDSAVAPVKSLSGSGPVAPAPSAAGTDYAAALAWARDRCASSRKAYRDVYVFTDLQRTGLDRGERVAMPAGVEVRVVDVGRTLPKNVAVTGLSASPSTVRPGGSATVTARVFNGSIKPLAGVPVRLHLESGGAARDLDRTVDLAGGATAEVAFALEDLPEGLWRGSAAVEVEGDVLALDDRRYLALVVAPPVVVRLIDGDPGANTANAETYFLEAALRLAPRGEQFADSPFDPSVVAADAPGRAAMERLSDVGAVVLANVGALADVDLDNLSRFVASGGGLIVFTGDRVGPAMGQALVAAGLGVGKVVGPVEDIELPWRLSRWDTAHPIFAPFADPEHGDLRRTMFTTITRIEPDPSARVLASFRGGHPALLERAHGRGRVLWFTSSCDRDWGDWPRGRMFVPLVHQMVSYALGSKGRAKVRQELPVNGKLPGVREEGDALVVVNPDPFEADLARCTADELGRRFGFKPSARPLLAGGPAPRPPGNDGRVRPDEVWPWFAAALLGVLLLEAFLANRTAV